MQRPLITSLLVVLLSGCGTIHSQFYYWSDGEHGIHHLSFPVAPSCMIYGGVRTDAALTAWFYDEFYSGPERWVFWHPLPIIDMIPSAILDTAMLPMTIPQHFEMAGRFDELLPAVEEHFELTINEEDVGRIATPRDLHEFVWSRVDRTRWTEATCKRDLQQIISRVLKVEITLVEEWLR